MSGTLVVGLGSALAGDDGVGWHVAARLADHPRLPPDTDVIQGGTDLLRLQDRLMECQRLVVVDALLDGGPCGRVLALHDLAGLDDRAGSVHHLSPAHALQLLRSVHPDLRNTPVTFVCVTVGNVRIQPTLSPALTERLDAVVDEVIQTVATHRG